MLEPESGVRRLCMAVADAPAGLLPAACRADEFASLSIVEPALGGPALAVARPGANEAELLRLLVGTLLRELAEAATAKSAVLAALHVGIVRLSRTGFGGPAVARVLALACDPAMQVAADASGAPLAVALTDGLYSDLRMEGLPRQGWRPTVSAGAWLRPFNAPFADLRARRSGTDDASGVAIPCPSNPRGLDAGSGPARPPA
jgi:hypothetical protein